MMNRTPVNALRIGIVLVLAVAAAVVANIVLLGVATGPNDPVGKLSPRAGLVRLPSTNPTAPVTTTDTTTTSDDSSSRGRGRGQDD